jgi:hypothetical protein
MKTKFYCFPYYACNLFAQEITGSWSGELKVQGMPL